MNKMVAEEIQVEGAVPVRIGVLALQGSFREHISSLQKIPGVQAIEVRTKEQLASVSGLVIPGWIT
jgi:pyridoxal 5'-phosphate synthase pdxT subunit